MPLYTFAVKGYVARLTHRTSTQEGHNTISFQGNAKINEFGLEKKKKFEVEINFMSIEGIYVAIGPSHKSIGIIHYNKGDEPIYIYVYIPEEKYLEYYQLISTEKPVHCSIDYSETEMEIPGVKQLIVKGIYISTTTELPGDFEQLSPPPTT